MATIAYDGIGRGGTLFEGMKFFITQRVPLRSTWIEQIEANGGQIVKLDKQADMVIADHKHKDAPTGSISWRYIEESVKKGRLEDIEDHRAGPATTVIHRPGTGQPMKTGRTPFTAEDDRILMEWVTRAERKGFLVKGNEIYRQLAEKNSKHTMQSWRNRWVKQLSYRPRPNIPSSSGSASPEPGFPPKTNGQQQPPSSQPRPKPPKYGVRRSPPPSSPVASQSEPRVPHVAKSEAGNKFSEEDAKLLLSLYDDIMNIHEDKAIDAWVAYSVEASHYPHHTAQEWRNFFVKEIMPKEALKLSKKPKKEPPDMNKASDNVSKKLSAKQVSSRPKVTPKSITEIISLQDEDMDLDPELMNEDVFKEDIIALARGLDLEVNFYPRICGRLVPLFKLWRTVMSDEFGGSARVEGLNLWPRVAKKLDFTDKFQHLDAPKSLKACYEEILVDFEQTREEFEQLGAEGADTQEEIEAQLRQSEIKNPEEFEEDYDDDLEALQSSPIKPISQKRSLNGGRSMVSFPLDSKRRRLGKGKDEKLEIPPTPEDKLNSFQKPQPFYQSSPLKSSLQNGQEEEHPHDFARSFPQPSFSRSKQKFLEPETQDFHFLPLDDQGDDTGTFYSLSSSSKFTSTNKNSTAVEENLYDDSSTQSQTDTQRAVPVISAIEYYVALGYPEEIVVEALEATTMETGDVGIVMECLIRGEGIPQHIQGVWTAEDDKALEDPETVEYEIVVGKHGEARVAARKEFLVYLRELKSEMIGEVKTNNI